MSELDANGELVKTYTLLFEVDVEAASLAEAINRAKAVLYHAAGERRIKAYRRLTTEDQRGTQT